MTGQWLVAVVWWGAPANDSFWTMPWAPGRKSGVNSSLTCAVMVVLSVSCGDITAFPVSGPVPVVQLLLLSGQSTQVASIGYSAPARPIVPVIDQPISSDSVLLELVAPNGTRASFGPVPGSPTRYQTELPVSAGDSYQLVGSVAGFAVAAKVTAPGPLQIAEPAEDTLALFSENIVSVNFRWSAAGAVSYLVQQIDPQLGMIQAYAVSDTSGTLGVFAPFADRPDTNRLVIWAYEQSGATFFLNQAIPTAPAEGAAAIVGFGAATPAHPEKTILWQP